MCKGPDMKRKLLYVILGLLLTGCVVVPGGDGYYRDGYHQGYYSYGYGYRGHYHDHGQ
jgi:hypothetical protein